MIARAGRIYREKVSKKQRDPPEYDGKRIVSQELIDFIRQQQKEFYKKTQKDFIGAFSSDAVMIAFLKINDLKEQFHPTEMEEKLTKKERFVRAFRRSFRKMIYSQLQNLNPFDKYIDEMEEVTKRAEARIQDTLRYVEIFREGHRDAMFLQYKNDPKFVWFTNANEEREVVLPILNHILDKTLCLNNYRLGRGAC